MPFGDYEKKSCGNPDCPKPGKMFKPVTPWQVCCSKECSNHRIYLLTVLRKRLRASEERYERMRKELAKRKDATPQMAGRLVRIGRRLVQRKRQLRVRLAGIQ
jgi:hypothetical protein